MSRILATGKQSFVDVRTHNCFYVDKTHFLRDWWNGHDDVTLITRPRRFGKTLMLDTVKTFFSPEFAGQSALFAGLKVWDDDSLRDLQGRIPVLFLSFANIKGRSAQESIRNVKIAISRLFRYCKNTYKAQIFSDWEEGLFASVHKDMDDLTAQEALLDLSEVLTHEFHNKPVLLLDEYDTPLQEAWLGGYWGELVQFMQGFFNSTFKTNTYLGRGLITGITRVSKESVFSDLNNLKVVSTTSDLYSDCFGFTEEEVFAAMDEYGLTEKEKVKQWYDGFIFGAQKEIYNPWSIISYLSERKFSTYWADTSSNALVGDLIAHGDVSLKEETAALLRGETIVTKLDEQISFSQLSTKEGAVWSLLMASGYVKPVAFDSETKNYELALTNHESLLILEDRISQWFGEVRSMRNKFCAALLSDHLDEMNEFLSEIAETVFSYFDTGKKAGNRLTESENFYHAFVLGLIVDLKGRYDIRSNRESGFGRYDVLMTPKKAGDHGIVLEFKMFQHKKEKDLNETCANALKQIEDRHYAQELTACGILAENIYVYGFAFQGKEVLICGGAQERKPWEERL